MIGQFFNIISKVLESLEPRAKWPAFVAIFVAAILVLIAYETFTGTLFYGNLERRVELLTQLHDLAQEDISSNSDLYPIYSQIVEELTNHKAPTVSLPEIRFTRTLGFRKAIFGASIWLILTPLALAGIFGEDKLLGAFVMLLFAAFGGGVGILIPTIINPWVNYIGWPLAQIALVIFWGSRLGSQPVNAQ